MIDELELLARFGTEEATLGNGRRSASSIAQSSPTEEARRRAGRALAAAIAASATAAPTAPEADECIADTVTAGTVTPLPLSTTGGAGGGPRRGRRSWRRRRWTVATAAAAVAAVAAAATVLANVVAPPGGPVGPTSAAAAVLDQAAQQALHAPPNTQPGPGQYLYLKRVNGNLVNGGVISMTKPSKLPWSFTTSVIQSWIAPDGAGRVVTGSPTTKALPIPPAVFTPQWPTTRKGSKPPDKIKELGPGGKLTPIPPSHGAGKIVSKLTPLSPTYNPPGTLAYPDANLPTSPAALRRAIVQRYERGHGQAFETFLLAGSFLQETASPALRAALYQVVASLPGVVEKGPATDRLGRKGIAVALLANGISYQLILDPKTSATLQSQSVVIDPTATPPFPTPAPRKGGGLAVGVVSQPPADTVASYTIYVSTGIVDSTTAVPPPA
ncbi:MAG: CU044_5270 family protein [Acidimicrobiales bacterium]